MGVPTLMECSISVGTPVEQHQNQAIAQKLGILEYQEHTEDVLRTTYLSTY